MALTLATLA